MTPTVVSPRFGVIRNSIECHACGQVTPVAALLVYQGRHRYDPDDDWYPIEGAALLTYVADLAPAPLSDWLTAAPWVQRLPSKTAGISYWANTCIHCAALQGDWFLTEADGPFFPTTPELEANMSLVWAPGQLEAVANIAESSWMDRLIERFPPYT